ncbi:Mitochondrial inner membrane protein OXA1L [Fasciola gigantica]|uniref:Mitochondrial inner membrane protein OXA1L n=1 Tax=Fasciola gigantica TaxID=46835 RepID=A0A504YFD5_FASGI|nr:Mitochondrial inner membrane protein OXA1L [Fasciola gigantica]
MTSLPVPSMRTGGLAWFSDLTIPDPYYLLPLLSMSSILLMVETGADMSTQAMTPIVRTLMRGFPCVGFFMVMNMPSALLWYWTVSNFISLVQATILRLPAVRTWLKLPASSKPPPTLTKKRGFVEGFRETMTNSKLLAELEARERLDAKSWQEAGRGHIPRTFAYDPTKSPVRAKGTIVDGDSAVSANTANRRTASGKN